MFRSLTFLAGAVSALKVHQEDDGDAMTPYIEAMIQAYRDCIALVASGYVDWEVYDECAQQADEDFILDCGDDLDCVDVVGAIPEDYAEALNVVQDQDFWDAVLAD